MLAHLKKYTVLRADVVHLTADLRRQASTLEQRIQSATDPYELGLAAGYADALMLAAEKLDALLIKHPAIM